jgi:hypothetical protein
MATEKEGRIRSGGFSATAGHVFGDLEQAFDEVWWAWGTVRFAPAMRFPRNMVIVREKGELVVVHPVMMPEATQRKIEALGPIKHVVRLGTFHGMDDLAYVKRYGATSWAPPEVDLAEGMKTDQVLVPGGELPVAGAELFSFEASRSSELALRLDREGGVLLTCDSVQNWEKTTGCSLLAGLMAGMMGFKGRACIGPGWLKVAEPKDGVGLSKDFERLLALEFRHVIGAHGAPMKETAREDLRASVARLYPRR